MMEDPRIKHGPCRGMTAQEALDLVAEQERPLRHRPWMPEQVPTRPSARQPIVLIIDGVRW